VEAPMKWPRRSVRMARWYNRAMRCGIFPRERPVLTPHLKRLYRKAVIAEQRRTGWKPDRLEHIGPEWIRCEHCQRVPRGRAILAYPALASKDEADWVCRRCVPEAETKIIQTLLLGLVDEESA
jgi:hypothetical protein